MKIFAVLISVLTSILSFTVGTEAAGYIRTTDSRISVTEYLGVSDGEDTSRSESLASDFFNALPDEIKELFPDDSLNVDPASSSESFDVPFFIDLILKILGKAASGASSSAAILLSFAVVAFILRTVSGDGGNSRVASFVIRGAACIFAVESGIISFSSVTSYLKTLSVISASSVPASIAMLVSTGHVTSSGACAVFTSTFSSLCETIYSGIVLPMIAISSALVFAESASVLPSAVRLSTFVRKAATWIAVGVSAVASFVFGVQSLLSNASDTVGIKTVKFAIGAFVPFVGGAVGDTVSAAAAGASSVKTVFGVVLLVILFAVILSPLATLFAGKIVLAVSSAFSGILGCEDESRLFSSMSEILSSLIALVAASGAVFAVIVAIFISYGSVI